MPVGQKRTRRKKNTVDEILAAIKGSAGIKMTIATKLRVERHTVTRYIETIPSVFLAYKNEVNAIGDLVETTILKAIQANDIETAKWYAKNKLKDRGYSERIEWREVKDLSDAELVKLIQERAGVHVDADTGSGTAQPQPPPVPTLH